MFKPISDKEQHARDRKRDKDRAARDRILAAKVDKLAHKPRNTREDLDILFSRKETKE
jgi:hypothetical protein